MIRPVPLLLAAASLVPTSSLAAQQSEHAPPVCVSSPAAFCSGYGFGLAPVGDLDPLPDGVRDQLIGMPGQGSGTVFVRSGADCGSLLQTLPGLAFNAPGYGTQILFGASVDRVGDVNLDGVEDFLVGAPGDVQVAPPTASGQVVVIDGASGTALFPAGTFVGASTGNPQQGARLGRSVSGFGGFGDTGDSGGAQPGGFPVPDFLAGAPMGTLFPAPHDCLGNGYVSVYDGATGGVRYVLDANGLVVGNAVDCPPLAFGTAVDGLGDLDEDGFADMVVGAPRTSFGHCVISGEDCSDFDLLGDHHEVGAVYVFSGAGGVLLTELNGPEPLVAGHGGWFGFDVALAGDVDADGRPDVIVGAPLAEDPRAAEIGRVGAAFVYSGASLDGSATPERLHAFYGDRDGDHFGARVSSAGDLDGDGHDDVMVRALGDPDFVHPVTGEAQTDTAYVRLFSGRTGMPLYAVDGLQATPISEVPDIAPLGPDGGGGPLRVQIADNGTCSGDTTNAVEVHAVTPFPDQLLGYPAVIDQPGRYQLFIAGGSALAFREYWVLGSATGSFPGITPPLIPDGYFHITVTQANVPPLIDTFGVLDASGSGTAQLFIPVPIGTGGLAVPLFHAAVFLDGTRVAGASGAVESVLAPW